LSRAFIEFAGDGIELGLSEDREIGAFREVLSQKAVVVLIGARCQGLAGSQKWIWTPVSTVKWR
jgi:hypothetical protein